MQQQCCTQLHHLPCTTPRMAATTADAGGKECQLRCTAAASQTEGSSPQTCHQLHLLSWVTAANSSAATVSLAAAGCAQTQSRYRCPQLALPHASCYARSPRLLQGVLQTRMACTAATVLHSAAGQAGSRRNAVLAGRGEEGSSTLNGSKCTQYAAISSRKL